MNNQNSKPHQKQVTVYRNLVEPIGLLTILQLINLILSTRYKAVQENIQLLFSLGQKEKANEEKKKLYSFSASCQCRLWRCLDNVTIYTSYIILDLDHLVDAELKRIWLLLRHCPYMLAAFRSPSWCGIKIIVETDAPMQDHKRAYNQVADYFERLLGCKIDRSGSDIPRLAFIGHDPWAFYNEQHTIFNVVYLPPPSPTRPLRPSSSPLFRRGVGGEAVYVSPNRLFNRAVGCTMKKRDFVEGNGTARSGRNNFVFLLSAYCRFFGLSEEDALGQILQFYNYDKREIERSVKSAYRYKPYNQ